VLRPRIIPVLLVRDNGLVKTKQFRDFKYVGDPLNAVRIFNEKLVDEIIVLDIDASANGKTPNFELIKKIASECRMPLCYGGGIKNLEDAKKIISLGVEKIAMSSSIIRDYKLINYLSDALGSQSIVGVLDVKRNIFGKYNAYISNGKEKIKNKLDDVVIEFIKNGIGEIVVNNIDNDGMLCGYDIQLIKKIKKFCNVPMTIIGGAGSLQDMRQVWNLCGLMGCGAGSLFVFKGKYSAILINYPNLDDKLQLLNGIKF
tara:strand:- start:1002 stop:1775 length:774 start_codon:yes stop_codon:yes gene_type:complete